MENYFTGALLYQEDSKASKQPLPDDDDNGNEADSEFAGDTPATLACEPIVACFNDPQYNNPFEDDDEWVINENAIFDYLVSVESLEYVENSSYTCLCTNQA